MMAVSWHADAGAEFAEAAAYYEEQDDGLGERFIAHADAAVAKLLSAPLIPRCVDGECRKVRLEKFPYAVIYRVGREAVQIIAVMHMSRRPGYWEDRLKG
jgi:toxin ParE1/3/4